METKQTISETPQKMETEQTIIETQKKMEISQQKIEESLSALKQDVLRMHNTLLLIHADMAVLLNPQIYNQPTKYDSSREMITGIIEHDSSSRMWDGIIEHNE